MKPKVRSVSNWVGMSVVRDTSIYTSLNRTLDEEYPITDYYK